MFSRDFTGDDRGSMPLAMLLVVLSVSLSALMSPMVLNQVKLTQQDSRRVHELHAAQAGVDVAMAYIRNTQDKNNKRNGLLNLLPCWIAPAYPGDTSSKPFIGRVDGSSTARYGVTIEYWKKDQIGRASCR